MKKILVLVLALLCVFSVAAMAETEAFQPDFGTHHFYKYTAENYELLKDKGYVDTHYTSPVANMQGFYDENGKLTNWNADIMCFGHTEATCTAGATMTLMCADGKNCSDSDNMITVTVSDPLPHNKEGDKVAADTNKPAKCEDGSQAWKCTACGNVWNEVLPGSGHELTTTVTPATCFTPEITLEECKYCDYEKTTTGKVREHVFPVDENKKPVMSEVLVKAATCLEDGQYAMLYLCQYEDCNATKKDSESYYVTIPKLVHTNNTGNPCVNGDACVCFDAIFDSEEYDAYDKVPSPSGTGYKKDANGNVYVEDVASADEVSELLEATVVEEHSLGADGIYGTEDDVIADVVTHKGYTYTVVAPTCEADGSLTIACKSCSVSVTYAIEKLTHNYVPKAEDNLWWNDEIDCTEGYKVVYTCTNKGCGATFQQNTVVCDEHELTSVYYVQKLGDNSKLETGRVSLYTADGKKNTDALAAARKEARFVDCLPYTAVYACDCMVVSWSEVDEETGEEVIAGESCQYTEEEVIAATKPHTVPSKDNNEAWTFETKKATCVEAGYIKYTCAVCKTATLKDIPVDEDAHKVEKYTTVAAECEKDGLKSGVCTLCEETVEQVIPMTSHNWGKYGNDFDYTTWKLEDKTCTEDGKYSRVCLVCDKEEKVVIPAGHTYNEDEAHFHIPATCTSTGLISYDCEVCHLAIENEVIPMLQHALVATDNVVDENCVNPKMVGYECANCGAKEVRTVGEALKHDFKDVEATVKDQLKEDIYDNLYYTKHATCEEAGEGYYICDKKHEYLTINKDNAFEKKTVNCAYKYEFEIEALGHMWVAQVDDKTGEIYYECLGDIYGDHFENLYDEFDEERVGCGATTKIETRAPIYNITIDGKKGILNPAEDNMNELNEPAYVRIVYDFQTKDGVSTSLIFMADVTFNGEVGTFKVPVIKTGMTMTGASYIVVTDADADELRYSQITNKYGELNL